MSLNSIDSSMEPGTKLRCTVNTNASRQGSAGISNSMAFDLSAGKYCAGSNISIQSNLSGTSYQWMYSINGTGFINVPASASHSGVNGSVLQINNPPSSTYGYQYKCIVDGQTSFIFSTAFSNTWTGAVNNIWNNPANWSCGTVPDANTDVSIMSGDVILNSNTSIRSLKLEAPGTLTVKSGFNLIVTH